MCVCVCVYVYVCSLSVFFSLLAKKSEHSFDALTQSRNAGK